MIGLVGSTKVCRLEDVEGVWQGGTKLEYDGLQLDPDARGESDLHRVWTVNAVLGLPPGRCHLWVEVGHVLGWVGVDRVAGVADGSTRRAAELIQDDSSLAELLRGVSTRAVHVWRSS